MPNPPAAAITRQVMAPAIRLDNLMAVLLPVPNLILWRRNLKHRLYGQTHNFLSTENSITNQKPLQCASTIDVLVVYLLIVYLVPTKMHLTRRNFKND